MVDYKKEFKGFFLKTVLPNTNSYKSFFNKNNYDVRIEDLILNYKKSFGFNPFELTDAVKALKLILENSKIRENEFREYSNAMGSGVPSAIIFTHYTKFLSYFNVFIKFDSLQSLINEIHSQINNIGKSDNFIQKFREFRKNIIQQSRIVQGDKLFGTVREEYWSINVGAEKELQYHIHLSEKSIKYGLGFNIQASQNNHDPVSTVRAYKDAFYMNRDEVDKCLVDYAFFGQDEEYLKKLEYGKFCLYGKEVFFNNSNNDNEFEIDGIDFLEILYNLKNKQFSAYKLICEKSKLPTSELLLEKTKMDIIRLIEYKKQVILQGPPGTGKTREAKNIAFEMIPLSKELLIQKIRIGQQITTVIGEVSYEIVYVDFEREKIRLKRESTTTNDISFDVVITYFNQKRWLTDVNNPNDRMAVAVAKFIYDNYLEDNEQFKLVQFHPSYTYEDFVRGITSKISDNGENILYEAENKTLGNFAKMALTNFLDSKKAGEAISKENWVNEQFDKFRDYLNDHIDLVGDYKITDKVDLVAVVDGAFRYTGANNSWNGTHRMSFKDIKQAFIDDNLERQDIKKNKKLSGSAKQHASYYVRIVKDFQDFLSKNNLIYILDTKAKVLQKNYILIIDEINRANLSSVLGELIYALEYRNENVDSMYALEGDTKLVLPENLFIIGTMNTADRSLGHIDYAIRRRFAFVNILPKKLEDAKIVFHADLFKKVAELFIKNYDNYVVDNAISLENEREYLSEEFDAKDVWLGHSYFIQKKIKDTTTLEPENFNIRVKYEIVPILREYVKDGILKSKATDMIDKIENAYSI